MGSKKRLSRTKQQARTRPNPNARLAPLGIGLVLVALTVAAFWPVLTNQFVNIDDDRYVTENSNVLDGLTAHNVFWAFTSIRAANWHPLTWISHMVDVSLYGLNPTGHHVTNLLLHLANVLLLFALLRSLTGAMWRSAFVAALFAVHPAHVESVAWVAERKDVLSALFCMLTIYSYVLCARKPGTGRYVLTVALYALGLLAKPMLVSLPFVLLLLDWWPLERVGESARPRVFAFLTRRLVAEKIPLFVLSAGSCAATFYAQRLGGAMQPFMRYPFGVRIENAVVSYSKYLIEAVWPTNLAVFYPYNKHLPVWQVAAATVFLIGATVLAARALRGKRYVTVGWFWYLITLLPVIGLIQVGDQARADRYTYLPLIGIFVIIVWGLGDLAARAGASRAASLQVSSSLPSSLQVSYLEGSLAVAGVLVIAALAIGARCQSGYWRDSITLMRHTLAVTTDNCLAENNYGVALKDLAKVEEARHDQAAAKDYYRQAEQHYREAIRINPQDAEGHYNLGVMLANQGRTPEAVRDFEAGLKTSPHDAKAHLSMGLLLGRTGDLEGALRHYRLALRFAPGDAETHYNMGVLFMKFGRYEDAFRELKRAVSLDPGHVKAYNNLGTVMFRRKRYDEAVRYFSEAIRIKPDYLMARSNLAVCYYYMGDYANCWAQVHECQRLGGGVPAGLIQALARKMPEPAN